MMIKNIITQVWAATKLFMLFGGIVFVAGLPGHMKEAQAHQYGAVFSAGWKVVLPVIMRCLEFAVTWIVEHPRFFAVMLVIGTVAGIAQYYWTRDSRPRRRRRPARVRP